VNVAEAAKKLEGTIVACAAGSGREILGGYASDLLSDVMGNGRAGDIWVTVQKHANIVAIAQLHDLAAIVLVNDRRPEPETIARAEELGTPIISTPLHAFEAVGVLYASGIRGRRSV